MAKISASRREETGTRQVRRLREAGRIPAIIYGHKQEAVPITLQQHEIELALQHAERVLEVNVGDQSENVLVKDVQYDTFGQHILHVDLARVRLDERVEVTVPIVLRGTPAGVEEEDGMLQQIASEVYIECVVTAIPEEIRVSVTEMKVGDTLSMSDLPIPEGATLLDEPDAPVCSVSFVSEEEVEEVEAEEGVEAAEPEVIGEQPEEGEEQEAPSE